MWVKGRDQWREEDDKVRVGERETALERSPVSGDRERARDRRMETGARDRRAKSGINLSIRRSTGGTRENLFGPLDRDRARDRARAPVMPAGFMPL